MKDRRANRVHSQQNMTRRGFLGGAATAAAFTIVPGHVLAGKGPTSPSEKVNVAIIGTGGQGIVNMKQLFNEPDVHIAALSDVNEVSDYSMFYYGGTAGLKPARELVRRHYGQSCPTYRDYHQMLDAEDIDAVLLATPDHSHAAIALAVIAKGKHLYCEKPLCRTVYETRVVTEAARKAGVATQLGNFGHSSEDIRLTCEWIWDGAIGDVHDVHAWTSTGARRWTNLTGRPKERPPVPAGFDWQRWLEPVPERPYHPDYAPVRWRAWWQFGSGTIGDFACHHLDPAFWALKLDKSNTFSVEASSCGTTEETCPSASLIYYHFPARAGMAPVRITWYEGGIMPPRPAELEEGRSLGNHGILFVGTKGAILGGGWSRSPRIIPETKMRAYKRPAKTLLRVRGHHRNWLDACRGKGRPSTHFDYAGPLTEFTLMGNVAIRAGKKLDFDSKNMNITNVREANEFIKPHYRENWTI
ncbi:MAG: Gfo/Idh/MocA family oxidoreductase [Phycisphaerales bacterium]|nr:MAG: Gfo/Idh/MocA family oxidoreductase [Phycisphaerales bacterium]